MSNAKHTPGPWFRHDPDELKHSTLVCAGDHRKCVARVFDNFDTRESNAHLIAAAPDLLAALRNIVQAAEADGWNYDQAGDSTVVDSARAAIAKAEGQS